MSNVEMINNNAVQRASYIADACSLATAPFLSEIPFTSSFPFSDLKENTRAILVIFLLRPLRARAVDVSVHRTLFYFCYFGPSFLEGSNKKGQT